MAGLKVLVVSGDVETRERLCAQLAGETYAVEGVESAAEALTVAPGVVHDLIVLADDITDAAPVEFLGRAREVAPRVPVVVLARRPSISGAVEAMRRGACHYAGVSDPEGELVAAVRGALGAKLEVVEEEERRKRQRPLGVEDLRSFEIIDRIMAAYGFRSSKLIGILQDVQKELRYLPQEALKYVAERLSVPLPRVYSVATFYQSFSLTPRGRRIIKVCMGTACHVRGAPRVLEELERRLGIRAGETTYDMEYTLLTVNCLGCCALGPVVVVDETYHSVRPWQVDSVLPIGDAGSTPGEAEAARAVEGEGSG